MKLGCGPVHEHQPSTLNLAKGGVPPPYPGLIRQTYQCGEIMFKVNLPQKGIGYLYIYFFKKIWGRVYSTKGYLNIIIHSQLWGPSVRNTFPHQKWSYTLVDLLKLLPSTCRTDGAFSIYLCWEEQTKWINFIYNHTLVWFFYYLNFSSSSLNCG